MSLECTETPLPGLEQGRDLAKVTKPLVPELAANPGAPPNFLYLSGAWYTASVPVVVALSPTQRS